MSLDKKIADLEKRLAERSNPRSPHLIEEGNRKFIDALAQAKRRIYAEGFEVDWLRGQAPVTVAAHFVWLTVDEDAREDEVREVLEDLIEVRDVDGASVWRLVETSAGALREARREREEAADSR